MITNSLEYTVEETFELYIDNVEIDYEEEVKDLRFRKWSNLYHQPYKYEPLFWVHYATHKEFPLNDTLVQDLEQYSHLEMQYEVNSKK